MEEVAKKPKYLKIIKKVNVDNLLEFIEKSNISFFDDSRYNRKLSFFKCKTYFLIDRTHIKDKKIYNDFIFYFEEYLKIIKEEYGDGIIYNVQIPILYGGGIITPHIDAHRDMKYVHRIHIPLITNDKVIFTLSDKEFYLKKGEIVEVNNCNLHGVVNTNSEDHERLHIIIDFAETKFLNFLSYKKQTLFKY